MRAKFKRREKRDRERVGVLQIKRARKGERKHWKKWDERERESERGGRVCMRKRERERERDWEERREILRERER
jgi:hypothetical protein